MIIRSTRPESNFYLLDKTISEDKKLSWAARGLLIFLLGKPDNWRVSVEYLSQQTNESAKKTGKQGIYSLLDELIDVGYVVRSDKQAHDEKTGFLLGYDYTVYDSPCKAQPYNAEPCMAKPDKVKPCKANRTLISIDNKQGLNKNNNISNDAKKLDDEVIKNLSRDDSRKNFALQLDWKPNLSQFGAYCLNNGISPSQLTDNILKLFNEKANAKGEVKTEAQWCLYLAKYLKTCLNNPQLTTTPKHQTQTTQQAAPVTTFKKDEAPKKTKAERMAMFEQMTNLAGVN